MRGVQPRRLAGLAWSLCLWPLVLNLHTYVASLVSTVVTVRKIAVSLLACFGTLSPPQWLLSQNTWRLFCGCLDKEAGHPVKPPAFTPLQHDLCLSVTCSEMFFTSHFQVERLVLGKCLTYPSSKDLKIVVCVLKFCTKFHMDFILGKC